MSDEWLVNGLPIEGEWTPSPPCATPGGPTSAVDNIIITGAPGSITSIVNDLSLWALVLNDGTPAADFRLDRFDNTGALASSPMTIVRATGVVTFNDPVMLAEDPLQPLEAATKNYVDTHAAGLTDAPNDGTLYARKSLAWSHITHADITDWAAALAAAGYIGDAPSDTTTYARNNAAWVHLTHTDISDWALALATYVTDAPSDGTAYARKSAAWSHLTHNDITDWAASLPAPYVLPTASTTVLGGVKVDGSTINIASGVISASAAAPSTTLPLANGVAAVGVGTTWARADHVHPSDVYPHDNRIINGDMRIDQRNNGASGTAQGYCIDRWNFVNTTAPTGRGAWQRASAGAPLISLGFGYSLGFTSSSSYAAAAADQFIFYQPVEADMISDFAWGTANAQPVTLSFLVNSSLTGTFSGALRNYPTNNRSYPFSFSVPAAGTWTKIVVTIPGDTTGAWVMSGNAGALSLSFDLGSGANFRGPAGAWASANYSGVTGAVSTIGTNGASFSITGVKLELGAVATPYNRQSLPKSMTDCQRYFAKTYSQVQVPGSAPVDGTALWVWTATGQASSLLGVIWCFPVLMRTTPTVALYSPHTGNSGRAYIQNGAVDVLATITGTSDATVTLSLNSANAPASDFAKFHATASAEL